MKEIVCLAIESSCDETAAAVVRDGRIVESNVIVSQIDIHKKYGGVVPEIASRQHTESINLVVEEALKQANRTFDDIDIIGVTAGPGLIGALLVGVSAAKGLAYALKKPLVPVHHIKGHIFANFIEDKSLEPPFLCMVVSGGHTHLIKVKSYSEFEILGKTMDDAIGEAFDKVARTVGLGYPGGPLVDQAAQEGQDVCHFPRPVFENLNFSFSGIKTAVINYVHKTPEFNINDVCRSFEEAVTDVVITNIKRGMKQAGMNKIALAGGVAANRMLREKLKNFCEKNGYQFYYPAPVLCTDNAAMIGCAAYYDYLDGKTADLSLNATANLSIEKDL
ncbi:MAG: tRNA (adenosine(37)-N6)-threonylcarbamoyltransferase complex transferase subunit TsaD [Clostridia bacterium]|nr:tRNA (adenosine(37)-N6)-threonylcarbamoyltransferase complex transferase subunit TsaD [Clostridia bacterium]